MYEACGKQNGGYAGYSQVGTDVPLANAEAMLGAFFRLRNSAPSTAGSIEGTSKSAT